MADGDLTVDLTLDVTLPGEGTPTVVDLPTKTIEGMTEKLDKTVTIGATTEVNLWDVADAGDPDDWEVGIVQVLTSTDGAVCSIGLTGDAVLLALQVGNKLPLTLPSRDAGATTAAVDGKITVIDAHNPGATPIVVRLVLFGPEA